MRLQKGVKSRSSFVRPREVCPEMSTTIVKRFVRKFAEGGRAHYSIRRRSDGLFQAYHDDPFRGIKQPYEFEEKTISGLFSDIASAETELLRVCPDLEPES